MENESSFLTGFEVESDKLLEILHHDNALVPDDEKILQRKEDMPAEIFKFWKQRFALFYRFEEGIKLTRELWYSVTAEEIAIYCCKFMKHCLPDSSKVLDLCSGGGGNAAHFAKYFDKVYCIDINMLNLQCCYHNVGIYGKSRQKKLSIIQADWTYAYENKFGPSSVEYPEYCRVQKIKSELIKQKIDVAFCSPPWGGVSYMGKKGSHFDLDSLLPLPLDKLLRTCLDVAPNVAMFLPKNCDIDQIDEISQRVFGHKVEVRVSYVYLRGFLKGLLVFWGDAFTSYRRASPEVNMDDCEDGYDEEDDEEMT